MPHGTRRACRARRPGDANGNAAQTGGLARQVRQRMNRLGKPEHRARFCFFSKKKSPAGTRRFRIPSKSKFRWALTAAPSSLAAPKNPSPTTALRRRLRHRARRNHRRITPCHARSPALCATTPPQTTAFGRPYRIIAPLGAALIARLRRARAGFQSAARYSKSMPRPPPERCKQKRRPNRRRWRGKCGKG